MRWYQMTDKDFINKFDNGIDFSADEILSICNGFIGSTANISESPDEDFTRTFQMIYARIPPLIEVGDELLDTLNKLCYTYIQGVIWLLVQSSMTQGITIKIKLALQHDEDISKIINTMEQYRQACNYISEYIFIHGFQLTQLKLHKER